jgi:hypothetical protein
MVLLHACAVVCVTAGLLLSQRSVKHQRKYFSKSHSTQIDLRMMGGIHIMETELFSLLMLIFKEKMHFQF